MKYDTLHERLRAETRELHEDLEAAVDIERELASVHRYAAYLGRLWSLHASIERAMAQFDFSPLGFEYRRCRSRDLEADMTHLGIKVRPGEIAPPPARVQCLDSALGCIYVVEGSALGARAILPLIKARLGLTPRAGASFFVGFDEEGKAVWRACLAALQGIEGDGARADRVIAGAVSTFLTFRQWLPARLTSSSEAPVPFT
jgi:heme oxygenase